ncbi:MAG: LuxR C-terminal-related transcriptional regulator [Burkholderiaceae bacterium]|jgi:LuxR family maltose regulon positive regulatory protein|nr:LuxR C-terminal-related transcriptional regulator [Burkholderiaceae bacterium]MCU0963630.1 LuxR C-terminal-related transcriptional regulator [Burkholderiaceae bacterium]
METSVHNAALLSRLRPPRPSRGVIARARLDGLLDLVRTRALTVVKAPPGYGKTTVAQSWAEALAGEGARVAWLSLGAQDNEEERFFAALSHAAARPDSAGVPRSDELTVRELSIPLRHRVEWLTIELCADPSEFFLMLDDYQEITRPEIHQALAAQLRHLPPQMHIVIIGRGEPAIDLSTLRTHDAVLEVDAQMLRFDLAETQQLLRKSPGGAAAEREAGLLHELTGGWVAALRAAMLSAQLQGHGAQAVRRAQGAPRSINALFTDLLAQLPAELRDFLECTSVAERLCAALATRLSGRADAQELLARLERQQLFITALDDQQQWYALHRLFRDFLQRSAEQRDAALLPARHREAAEWCAEQGLWSQAIGHALAAGDKARALAWIEQVAMAVVGAGDLLTLLEWERQLRAHLVESPLRLRLAFAWGLGLAMACDKALVLLDGVEAQLGQATDLTPAQQDALRCECVALRSVVVCTTGDYELAAQLAEQCGSERSQPPWVVNALRNVVAAASLHSGRWDRLYVALPVHGDGRGEGRGVDSTARAYRLSIRGLGELRQGHLEEAAALLEEGLAVGAGSAPLAALPAPTLALVRYLQDRTADSARINAEHMEVNQRVAPIEGLCHAYMVASRLARLDGQAIRARHLLDEADSIATARGWRRAEVMLLQEKVRLCLLDGRLAEAAANAGRMERLAAEGARSALDRLDYGRAAAWARAWCDLAGMAPLRAAQSLRTLLDEARRDGRRVDAIGLAGALALAQQAAGDTAAAGDALREACTLVKSTGAVRALLDVPGALAPLLQALTRGPSRALRDASGPAPLVPADTAAFEALLLRLQRTQAAAGDTAPVRPVSAQLQSLSPREHHILQLLADGRTNKEIARGLGIAPETVKTHVSKIFGKLGAQNRAQAVAMVMGG